MGIPHPTGYPLYLLTGRLFFWLSAEPARALNLASAFWSSLGSGMVTLFTFQFILEILFHPPEGQPEISHPVNFKLALAGAGGLLAGFSLAFAPLVWSQAVITEVYGFNLFLTALLLLAAIRFWLGPENGNFYWLALAAGLAISHHRTAVFTTGAIGLFLILIFSPAPAKISFSSRLKGFNLSRGGLTLGMALFLGSAVLPALYLLGRGGAEAASNWSNPGFNNLAGFWEEFSGAEYRNLLFAAPLSQSLGRVLFTLNLLLQQFTPPGFLLGLAGLAGAWLVPNARPFFWFSAAGLSLHTFFAAVYAADNSQVYLIPVFVFWSILAGWGLAWVFSKGLFYFFEFKESSWIRVFLTLLAWLLALLIPTWSLFTGYARVNLAGDRSAEEWARVQAQAAPPNAMLVSQRDSTTFALWYVLNVQHFRPDLVIIDNRLLASSWYLQNLSRLYPDLQGLSSFPAPAYSGFESWSKLAAANASRPVVLLVEPPSVRGSP